MEIMEIILLAAGGLIFILSFFIPDGKGGEGKSQTKGSERLTEQELKAVEERAERLVEELLDTALEKAERSLEKLSNEKIMAVGEYSDTVLAEIHKNHEEAVFLYDMLNNKHIGLKNALGDLNRAVKEAEAAGAALERKPSDDTREEKVSEGRPEGKQPAEAGAFAERQPANGTVPPKKGQGFGRESLPEPAQTKPAQNEDGQERNNNIRILELYRQGKTIVDIAKELDLGVGEVKLVVDLFEK